MQLRVEVQVRRPLTNDATPEDVGIEAALIFSRDQNDIPYHILPSSPDDCRDVKNRFCEHCTRYQVRSRHKKK